MMNRAGASTPLRVIITAGASGIGHAIASGFFKLGHAVHICDIAPDLLSATVQSLPGMKGTIADVGYADDIDRLFRDAFAWLGGVDVLINNAGIGGPRAAIEDIGERDWENCLRVNLNGPFMAMKRAIPAMKSQRSGCIINISTSSARTGLPNRSAYVTSKVGLIGLTSNAARELGPWNIRCNALLPGIIENDRGRDLIAKFADENDLGAEEAERQYLSHISMRTMIAPSEIAEATLFLAGTGGRHISGQILGICGNAEWEA